MIKKKGQGGEMIGLLVIIILILVLVAIYFRFASKPSEDITAQTSVSIQSSNLLSAMMLYSVCPDKDIKEAIKICANGDGPVCGRESSCDLVKREVNAILESTLNRDLKRESVIFGIFEVNDDGSRGDILNVGGKSMQIPEGKELNCRKLAYPKTGEIISLFPGRVEVTIGRCVF